MKYRIFMFDVDDTLLDFKATERVAFFNILKAHDKDHDLEKLFATYQKESVSLWLQLEKGEITKEFLTSERFRRAFDIHEIGLDAKTTGETYLDALAESAILIEQAKETCEYLSKIGQVGLVTNGVDRVQKRRLELSGLAPFISFTAVSEAAGYSKPDVRIFEYAARQIENFSKAETLMIGDRLQTDILGAQNFGIDTCYFNPHKIKGDESIVPKYEISNLSELRGILGL
jgi:2-haloacid dehalogenase